MIFAFWICKHFLVLFWPGIVKSYRLFHRGPGILMVRYFWESLSRKQTLVSPLITLDAGGFFAGGPMMLANRSFDVLITFSSRNEILNGEKVLLLLLC